MTITIALAGKGGTGKTTFAALLIKYLIASERARILAIDADPSANLNLALGLPLEQTIGDIREEMLDQVNKTDGSLNGRPGHDQVRLPGLRDRIRAGRGRPGGPAGHGTPRRAGLLLRGEPYPARHHRPAGHVLRLSWSSTTRRAWSTSAGAPRRDVDALFIVTDPTVRGVVAAGRIADMRNELDINIKHAVSGRQPGAGRADACAAAGHRRHRRAAGGMIPLIPGRHPRAIGRCS